MREELLIPIFLKKALSGEPLTDGAPVKDLVDEKTPFYMDGAGHIYTSTKMAAEMLCHNYRELYL